MKISFKNIPKFLGGGVSTVTWANPNSSWFDRSGEEIINNTYTKLKILYDNWKATGLSSYYTLFKDLVNLMNEHQRKNYYPGYSKYIKGNYLLFSDDNTSDWQRTVNEQYHYINDAIGRNFQKYNIHSPNPTSGDHAKSWTPDGYWAGITQDRTPWGFLTNPNDPRYKLWVDKFKEIGIDYRTDINTGNVLYGFLSPDKIDIPSVRQEEITGPNIPNKIEVKSKIRTREEDEENNKGGFFNRLAEAGARIFGNPSLYEGLRLYGNLANNERVYDEYLKGIRPFLRLSYNTYRQVVGDEATKQAYYRRAALGLTKAARPFTSDADRQMAYQMEAKRIGDELRAQGDLADNQRIRETSELSSQHLDANRLRATEVANANLASLIEAGAKKHALLAQKHSAQWSSIDNYLQEIAYRKRLQQAEDKAIDDHIWALNRQNEIENDSQLLKLRLELEVLENDPKNLTQSYGGSKIVNYESDAIKNKIKEINNRRRELEIETYQLQRQRRNNGIWFSKSGSKITYKKKDDLLYKSAKDVVEHFRKMIALDKRSNGKSNSKIEKLAPHPKGTKKYQLGGVAPFTIYKPVALGGETSVTSETGSSSKSSSKSSKSSEDNLDLLKELFKTLLTEGLPSDTNVLFSSMMLLMNRKKAFGTELSSDDIATMFINLMYKLNTIKYNKSQFDKALEIVHNKDADSEIAITPDGRIAVLNVETNEIEYKKLDDIEKGKYVPLTNQLLLNFRALSPNMAFDRGIVLQTALNATSMGEIAKFLNSYLPLIESSESTLEGYTKKDTADIKSGIALLLQDAPEGDYKYTLSKKTNSVLAQKALSYLYNILPSNMRNLLNIKSGGNAKELIATMIGARLSSQDISKVDAATGKAAKNADGSSKEDGLKINSATQLLLGMSSPREFVFSIGNGNMFNGMARVSSITKDGNPMGADFAYSDIYKSDLHKNLDLDNASFGDIPINKSLKDRIIIDNSTIAGIDLPYTTDRNGRIIPDFEMLNKIEEADLEILKLGINPETEPQRVNEIYAKHNLPIKYGADNRLTGNYKRFAVILATAIEDVFLDKSGLASNGTLSLVSDEEEINKYINEIKKTTGEKEVDMDRPGLFTGDKDIFKGSIFIPIIGDLVDAASATGELKAGNYDELRNKYLTKNYNKAPLFVKQ